MATRFNTVKGLLLSFVALTCGACIHRHRTPPPAAQAPAFATSVSYLGQSGIGFGCLPRTRDSTLFEVDVILDSLRDTSTAAFLLLRRERSASRPGYIYQAVTVEVQLAGQTRFVGTSCWHDAGIVIRGPATALAEAKVYLDAPGTIRARAFNGRGTVLVDTDVDKQSSGHRVSWMPPPPNER